MGEDGDCDLHISAIASVKLQKGGFVVTDNSEGGAGPCVFHFKTSVQVDALQWVTKLNQKLKASAGQKETDRRNSAPVVGESGNGSEGATGDGGGDEGGGGGGGATATGGLVIHESFLRVLKDADDKKGKQRWCILREKEWTAHKKEKDGELREAEIVLALAGVKKVNLVKDSDGDFQLHHAGAPEGGVVNLRAKVANKAFRWVKAISDQKKKLEGGEGAEVAGETKDEKAMEAPAEVASENAEEAPPAEEAGAAGEAEVKEAGSAALEAGKQACAAAEAALAEAKKSKVNTSLDLDFDATMAKGREAFEMSFREDMAKSLKMDLGDLMVEGCSAG